MGKYLGRESVYGMFDKQTFASDGIVDEFSLKYKVSDASSLLVIYDDEIQEPHVDYVLNNAGNSIKFNFIPANGLKLYASYLGKELGYSGADAPVSWVMEYESPLYGKNSAGTVNVPLIKSGNSNNTVLGFLAGNALDLQNSNGIIYFKFSANRLSYSNVANIVSETVFGNDNAELNISGGGLADHTRGGFVKLFGNTHAETGRVIIGSGANDITFSVGAFQKLHIRDLSIEPQTNNTYDIGSGARKFKDLYIGRVYADEIHGQIIGSEVRNEIPAGIIDGINTVYTTVHNFNSDSIMVYVNGIRMCPGVGNDFEITGLNEITFTEPLKVNSRILIDYKY